MKLVTGYSKREETSSP